MTKYKHNMRKPSYLTQHDQSDNTVENLDQSKTPSSASYLQASGLKQESPFINYSDNDDARRK